MGAPAAGGIPAKAVYSVCPFAANQLFKLLYCECLVNRDSICYHRKKEKEMIIPACAKFSGQKSPPKCACANSCELQPTLQKNYPRNHTWVRFPKFPAWQLPYPISQETIGMWSLGEFSYPVLCGDFTSLMGHFLSTS